MTTRAQVVAEARSWLGTPYRHQASLKGIGADCIGFVGGVGLALGLPEAVAWAADPTVKGYGRSPDSAVLMAACRRYLDPINKAVADLGDILVLRFDAEPQHFAILSERWPRRIIHGYAAARKVAEMSIDGEWRIGVPWHSLIVSAWRFRGVD